MRKSGKKYVEASKKVDRTNLYTPEEAVKLVKETSVTSFDSTIEVAFNLCLDTKKADQQLRGSMVLPNGTGKSKRVLVIAKGEAAEAAKAAGADFVGEAEMIEKIEKENWFDYDVIVATPDMMAQLGKIGRASPTFSSDESLRVHVVFLPCAVSCLLDTRGRQRALPHGFFSSSLFPYRLKFK